MKENMETLDSKRVEIALRELIADIDYDLHKNIECEEGTGEDDYPRLSHIFLRNYEKAYRSAGVGE